MVAYDDEIFTTWTGELADGRICVLCLCGELDALTTPAMLTQVHDVIGKSVDVVVDVHLLSYVDSTGLAAILSLKNALQGIGRRMCLAGCHGLVQRILEVTNIHREFKCFEDVDAAAIHMAGRRPC